MQEVKLHFEAQATLWVSYNGNKIAAIERNLEKIFTLPWTQKLHSYLLPETQVIKILALIPLWMRLELLIFDLPAKNLMCSNLHLSICPKSPNCDLLHLLGIYIFQLLIWTEILLGKVVNALHSRQAVSLHDWLLVHFGPCADSSLSPGSSTAAATSYTSLTHASFRSWLRVLLRMPGFLLDPAHGNPHVPCH